MKQISTETPEQRQARYRQNQKNREAHVREERKREVAQNQTKDRRLSFLVSVITALGYKLSQVGRMCGFSQQSISWMFGVVDDCLLSKAEKLLGAVGITLKVRIKKEGSVPPRSPKPKSGSNKGVKFRIEGRFAEEVHLTNPKMPDYVNNCTPSDRMYFLALYLPTCGMPITSLMKKCGIQMASLSYIFTHDDIKISQLFKIAKATGGEIVWKVD